MCGNKCTYITPVYCGHALDYLTKKIDIGGDRVTMTLMKVRPRKPADSGKTKLKFLLNKLMANDGCSFTTTAELAILKDIKVGLSRLRACRVVR